MNSVTLCAVVMLAGSLANAQVSFTPIQLSSSTGMVDLSGDGTRVLLQTVSGGSSGPPTFSNSILQRTGAVTALYVGTGRGQLATLDFQGVTAWGIHDGPSGNVRKVSGPTAASSTTYFAGFAFGVSDSGNLVVGAAVGPTNQQRGFIWSPLNGPTPTILDPVNGLPYSSASAISPNGVYVVGSSTNSGSSPIYGTPTRWPGAGGAGAAMTLPGGKASAYPTAVADNGVSVGYVEGATFTFHYRAMVWDAAGVGSLLPMLLQRGQANAISADGSVIGGYEITPAVPADQEAAVLWLDGVRTDLTVYLTEHGVNLTGYRLTSVKGVSSDGTVVAGSGKGPGNVPIVFFATISQPPAPCTADLGVQGGTVGSDGQLDNNDFIAFISLFFAADPRADLGVQGGLPGADGAFNNNDFIAFINAFFAGCP